MPAPVNAYSGVPTEAWSDVSYFDPSSKLLIYYGRALSRQPAYTLTVVAATAAADTSFQVTSHGLQVDNKITISGATGDWAALNGSHAVKTKTDANNFTIEASSSGFTGTFYGVVTSTAPRTTDTCWQIQKYYPDANGNSTRTCYANGTQQPVHAWDSAATYSYQ